MKDRIFRIGESGIEVTDERIRALMNNMVNAQTPGFRASNVVTTAFPLELETAMKRTSAMEPRVEEVYYRHTPGALIKTGGSTDLAIGGEGFFVIACPWGEGYTRDGRFVLDKEGRLVTVSQNYPLLGERGPIVVIPGSRVEISQTGIVRVDDNIVDRIKIVKVDNPKALEPVSGSIFRSSSEFARISEVETPRVIQGYVESSNASMVDEMMELVMLSRLYNINTKIIATRDAMLLKAEEMGRPTP